MQIALAVFLFGCLVSAMVAMGLALAMSTVAPDDPGAFEGEALSEDSE